MSYNPDRGFVVLSANPNNISIINLDGYEISPNTDGRDVFNNALSNSFSLTTKNRTNEYSTTNDDGTSR